MERAIFELDAIGLAAAEKFDGILADERHIPQIQNQSLTGCLGSEQLSELFDVVCLDPATEREQDFTIPCSPSSEHGSSCLKISPRHDAPWFGFSTPFSSFRSRLLAVRPEVVHRESRASTTARLAS
jgi:hypothetical protein